jgi:hypothetical protein
MTTMAFGRWFAGDIGRRQSLAMSMIQKIRIAQIFRIFLVWGWLDCGLAQPNIKFVVTYLC